VERAEFSRNKRTKRSAHHTQFSSLLQDDQIDDKTNKQTSDILDLDPSILSSSEEPLSLSQLLENVRKLGVRFSRAPTMEALHEYRTGVSKFLVKALSHSLKTEQHTSDISVLKRKRYTLVKVINHELTELIAGMLQSQDKAFQMLQRLDKIEGLLVNLVR